MEKLFLNNGAELLLKPSKSNVSYFYVVFKGGTNTQTLIQQAHLTEHVTISFDVKCKNETCKNNFMGHYHADAKTADEYMRFQFFVTNLTQLKEMFDILCTDITQVIIPVENLEKEKSVIVAEYETLGFNKLSFSKDELINGLKKIRVEDIQNYINQNLTANNLKIFAISNLNKTDLIETCSDFANNLPISKTNNQDIDEDFQWNGKTIKDRIIPGLNYYDKDLNIPISVDLNENKKLINDDVLSVNNSILTVNLTKMCDCTNYQLLAKLSAFQLFVNDYRNGIKKLLRHKKKLVYRTRTDLQIAPQKSSVLTKIYLCDNKDLTIEQAINWFDNIKNNGLTEQEFEIIKNDFEYSALTQPNLQDESFDFCFVKKDYIDFIKSLSLEEYNKFLFELLTQNKLTKKQYNNVLKGI